MSPYAPRIITVQINPEKIGELIGPKGKNIRGIQEESGAEITVDDTGLVTIAAVGARVDGARAARWCRPSRSSRKSARSYEGPVKSTTAFGAFVEIMPGTEGLVHISELQHGRTEKTEDVVKKGDRVKVKVIERDERGRLRLSMKALLPKPGADGAAAEPAYAEGAGRRSGDRRAIGAATSVRAARAATVAAAAADGAGAAAADARPRNDRG